MYSVTGVSSGAGQVLAVGAAEDQAALDRVQLGQAPALLGRGDVALHPGLKRPAHAAAAVGPGQRPLRPLAGFIQQAVERIDVGLLLADGIHGSCGLRRLGLRGDGIGLPRSHIS